MRNENIKERLKVESIAERCRKARLRWFWPRKEARPRIRRNGDGTTRENFLRGRPKQRWMDCVNRYMSSWTAMELARIHSQLQGSSARPSHFLYAETCEFPSLSMLPV